MKISDVRVIRFRTHADRWNIGQAGLVPQAEVSQTVTCIDTDEGLTGYFFGGGKHGDQDGMTPDEQRLIEGQVRDMILGADPFDRELIWKWMWVRNIPEIAQSVIDCALWDLAGRHVRADIETINLVREAVGPDMVLMYDVWGTYHTIEETIKVGRELERLDFYWFEHPMPEYRVESYRRLCRELSIPILAPEIAAGGVFTRAEWILQGASDMSRMDIRRGGITGCRKTAIVCEAFGQRCEIHMAGWGNLHVMGAMLAPGVDYDAPHPYLEKNCDPMDTDGYVALPDLAGLGYAPVWDYIDDNRVLS